MTALFFVCYLLLLLLLIVLLCVYVAVVVRGRAHTMDVLSMCCNREHHQRHQKVLTPADVPHAECDMWGGQRAQQAAAVGRDATLRLHTCQLWAAQAPTPVSAWAATPAWWWCRVAQQHTWFRPSMPPNMPSSASSTSSLLCDGLETHRRSRS